ncbi:aspartate/glutamate racemase family protein [candidate division KSB1 bacterium]|nr:aspartate/glutamate racemase family protein [candidate division KSB1 bacterium]
MAADLNLEQITIVVTDSGLGGMSVAAELAAKLRALRAFRRVRIVFFNSSFSKDSGYNRLEKHGDKLRIFNHALESMHGKYAPNLILIACNTLSILFPETAFARKKLVPVIGIVEAGANLIAEKLRSEPESRVILFGTQTTIDAGTHKRALIDAGLEANRIIQQACPMLESVIEEDVESEQTRCMISEFVRKALAKPGAHSDPFFASLNCTHYGYAMNFWRSAFIQQHRVPSDILNPNSRMLAFLDSPELANRFSESIIEMEVVSRVEIRHRTIGSICKLLRHISPIAHAALHQYQFNVNLFEIE